MPRSLIKLSLWLGLAALVLMLAPGLIHSSQAQEASPPGGGQVLSAVISVADVPVPTSQAQAPVQQPQPRWISQTSAADRPDEPHTVLCDGNGWPLTGSGWAA